MELKSPAFKESQYIPSKYTCDGDDISPPFEFLDVPEEAVSLVLTISDPDTPGGNWVHWLVWNISPKETGIKKDSIPENAVEGVTSFGKAGYGGPCPPYGTHVYVCKLYALDGMLPGDPTLKKQQIKKMMEEHIIDKAVLKGFYERGNAV